MRRVITPVAVDRVAEQVVRAVTDHACCIVGANGSRVVERYT
jgi:hypothetical protein